MRISLGEGVEFETQRDNYTVITHYPDGSSSLAERYPTDENMLEALDEGYTDCWTALVEHELLHTLISRVLWRRESRVVRYGAGTDHPTYAERLYEEAVVLFFQYRRNTGKMDRDGMAEALYAGGWGTWMYQVTDELSKLLNLLT